MLAFMSQRIAQKYTGCVRPKVGEQQLGLVDRYRAALARMVDFQDTASRSLNWEIVI